MAHFPTMAAAAFPVSDADRRSWSSRRSNLVRLAGSALAQQIAEDDRLAVELVPEFEYVDGRFVRRRPPT